MTDQLPPAGWYSAPHANNEQRYWDGAQWLEPAQSITTGDHDATALYPTARAAPSQPKKSYKGWIIGGSVAAGVLLIGGVGSALGLGGSEPESKPQSTVTPWHAPDAVEEVAVEPVMVLVPDVAGMTAADAFNAMSAVGLEPPSITSFSDPLAKVVSTSPAAGTEAKEGSVVTFTVEEKPQLSLPQQNAISKAQSYLNLTGFSHSGLIEQLQYEGFSIEDATFGADNSGADWNAECAEKAQSYLELTAFSRDGLYDQLAYEGSTPEQIDFGLAAVGY